MQCLCCISLQNTTYLCLVVNRYFKLNLTIVHQYRYKFNVIK